MMKNPRKAALAKADKSGYMETMELVPDIRFRSLPLMFGADSPGQAALSCPENRHGVPV